MSRTAALVGVFGTVQLYDLLLTVVNVTNVVNVLPPSNDIQISISHPFSLIFGNVADHCIVTCSPGYRTWPSVGEIRWAEYPLAALAVLTNCGAKLSATANMLMMNPRVFIFLFPWF